MSRPHRTTPGGVVYHVFNRGSRKGNLFDSSDDYTAFERLMADARAVHPVRIVAYCLLPNHWHMLLWPRADGVLSEYLQRLAGTHASRHRRDTRTCGEGAFYQSRYGDVTIVSEYHLLVAWRYIERNPISARLVRRAQDWRWSSARHLVDPPRHLRLDEGPCNRPQNWLAIVNDETAEIANVLTSMPITART